MKNEFELAFNEIRDQRALPQEVVLEALRTALISAYRRYSGASAAQEVDATIDPATGRTRILVEKEVVSEVESPLTEVSLEKARFYDPDAQLHDMVMVQVEGTTKQFGRIAAQTAKQVILQKIREAERDTLYEEYKDREGDIVTGTVQNVNNSVVTINLGGRAEAVMPRSHQIPGERYRQHDKVRVYVVEVKKTNKGPQIVVSRGHRHMLKRLLEFEVPEIYNGQVEIKSIAREAGYRSKVAVAALQEGIDPVGACVGMRGMRIQNIVRELHEEKIDVIEWQTDPKQFISRALSPARVTGVYLQDDIEDGRTAIVLVPDDQLSLAIGREGQNARLAAKLTGWRIDIKSVMEAVAEAVRNIDKAPYKQVHESHPDLFEDAKQVLAKRDANRTIMPEEYSSLGEVANLIETALMEQREEERQQRLAEIEAVKATVPEQLFETPISALDASPHILAKLESLENVGEVMWRFLIDEKRIAQMLRGLPTSAFESVKEALDDMMMQAMMGELPEFPEEPAADEEPAEAAAEADEPTQAEPEAVAEPQEPEAVEATDEAPAAEAPEAVESVDVTDETDEEETPAPPPETVETEDSGEVPAAFPMDMPATPDDIEIMQEKEQRRSSKPPKRADQPEAEEDFADEADDYEEEMDDGKRSKKKSKRKKRQLIYDEEAGRVVARRKRKGSRARDEWEDYID